MKIKGETIDGLNISEYFLILPLPDHIQELASQLRSRLYKNCKVSVELKGNPVLALAHFVQYDSWEERIVKLFNSISSKTKELSLELDGLGSYPTHTIFIQTKKSQALTNLLSSINREAKKFLQLNRETKPMLFPNPHITLTRKLTEAQFNICWPLIKDEPMQATCTIGSMTLLKRPPTTKPWQSSQQFPFLGFPNEERQTTLF